MVEDVLYIASHSLSSERIKPTITAHIPPTAKLKLKTLRINNSVAFDSQVSQCSYNINMQINYKEINFKWSLNVQLP